MTLLQANFVYDDRVGEREARSLARVRDVYGIWAVRFDEANRKIVIDYDASRLQKNDIASMLRNAGISLRTVGGLESKPRRGINRMVRDTSICQRKETNKMIGQRISIKLLAFLMTFCLAGAIAVAQNRSGGGQQQPSMPSQQPATPNPGTMGADSTATNQQQTMLDQAFVRKALEGGAAEVQLGQLAPQKSQSDDVKQFGQKMVQDHTQLGDQMKPIAQQSGVKEPKDLSKKDKQLMAKLESLSGSQFDEIYIQAMVKDHKQDLKEFSNEAQTTQDPNLKQAAQQGAGIVSQHLQMIQQIAQSHNVAVEGKSKTTASMQ